MVHKSLATKELVQVFESGEKTVLPAWDPMVCYVTSVWFQSPHSIIGCFGLNSVSVLTRTYMSNGLGGHMPNRIYASVIRRLRWS